MSIIPKKNPNGLTDEEIKYLRDHDEGGWQRGHHIGGPPGHPLHLCRACWDRGTPPVALPAKTKRRRKETT